MEPDIENSEINNESQITENSVTDLELEINEHANDGKLLSYILPLFLICFILYGFTVQSYSFNSIEDVSGFKDFNLNQISFGNKTINILSENDLSAGIKDTVYTTNDCWLELKINQQMVYQYWRNGKVDKYPVSTGNKYLSKGIESRPGLFAIFHKEERHESTQFNNAAMYHFMPFDMGVGFHSLDGTGYYGNLGVRPSSHGCIRMRHEDAKKLFKDCPLGTLVLGTNGYSARTVGFAPKDMENDKEYTKDEYKLMLAENLHNILEGDYYIKERKFFVVDPKIIPTFGVYISYDRKIPEKQKLPFVLYVYTNENDRLSPGGVNAPRLNFKDANTELYAVTDSFIEDVKYPPEKSNSNDAELIKKYFHNPIGILPYFPPDK